MIKSDGTGGMRRVCYPSGGSVLRRIAGFALIAAGAALIIFCVPYWAWWALLGAALITVGVILTRSG